MQRLCGQFVIRHKAGSSQYGKRDAPSALRKKDFVCRACGNSELLHQSNDLGNLLQGKWHRSCAVLCYGVKLKFLALRMCSFWLQKH